MEAIRLRVSPSILMGLLQGHGLTIGQELALQPAGHQHGVAHFKHDVAGALGDGGGSSRGHRSSTSEGPRRERRRRRRRRPFSVDLLVAQGQAVTVDGDNGQALSSTSKREPVWMGRLSLSLTAKRVWEIMDFSFLAHIQGVLIPTVGSSGNSSGSVARMLNSLMPHLMLTV